MSTSKFRPRNAMHGGHRSPRGAGDWFAFLLTRALRLSTDLVFRKRYAHRAVVLETVAAVPGMVGALLSHLRSLRRLEDDDGRIALLAEEAENERIHLMVFREIALPNLAERVLICIAQLLFFNAYFLLYLSSRRVAHRMSGYFEEEAIRSYSEFLARLDASELANTPAPPRAQAYWQLPAGARLNDVVRAVLQDEVRHRDVNHGLSDQSRR